MLYTYPPTAKKANLLKGQPERERKAVATEIKKLLKVNTSALSLLLMQLYLQSIAYKEEG